MEGNNILHKHIIGMFYYSDYSELVTAHNVAVSIVETMEFNKFSKQYGCGICKKEYSPKQYSDFRYSTDLIRFRHCPECGEKIDWKKVKVEIEEELDGRGYDEKN